MSVAESEELQRPLSSSRTRRLSEEVVDTRRIKKERGEVCEATMIDDESDKERLASNSELLARDSTISNGGQHLGSLIQDLLAANVNSNAELSGKHDKIRLMIEDSIGFVC